MLEVIRLEGHSLAQEDAFVSRDIHLLQVMPLTLTGLYANKYDRYRYVLWFLMCILFADM
jgi:hypothetical protein